MTGCGVINIVPGGEFLDSKLVNPDIQGGQWTNPKLLEHIDVSDITAEELAERLKALLNVPSFKDCHDAPLAPTANVASCANVDEKVAEATSPSKIAAVFKRTDDTNMSPGAKLMTAQEILDAIAKALCEAGVGEGATINRVLWDPNSQTLTIYEARGATLLPPMVVQLTGLTPLMPPLAINPMPSVDTMLPLNVYGQRTALLGMPARFLFLSINGTPGWIPWYSGA
jgi:hypothetical protein